MRIVITVLVIVLATLALANDLIKEKQTTLNTMQRSYAARENMIKAFQDSIVKYQDLQKLSVGYMMCLQDDLRKLQADSTKVKSDTTKKVKDGKR